ncbi:MAG: energy-coupling factor ABC transporter permease [Hydrogenophilus sp.]|nr:energy-coupling factor ABC transporter permease [Hydrogenophilus sp.]
MHVPDGFLSPATYMTAYGLAVPLWWVGVRRLRHELDAETLPWLAAVSALCFVLMQWSIPLPGGSSVHLSGIGLLAVLFGPWVSFLAVSLVLAVQSLVLGVGGVTTLAVNALAMGLIGSWMAFGGWRLLRRVHEPTALVFAGWLATVAPAAVVGVTLGVQPLVAQGEEGEPLFFPFDWEVTLPAVVVPHALLGVVEGVVTWWGRSAWVRLRVRHGE